MTDEQLKAAKSEILHIPMTLGAVVVTYNVPEAKSPLKFTSETIAGIFLGDIKKWNDPKLVADNPGLQNVNQDIVVVHRSDGSGTTFAFTDYLSAVSDTWKTKVGKGTAVNWPTGLGGKGNEGVTQQVKQTEGAIGYVELIYALSNNLPYAEVKNAGGQFVEPSLESVTQAAASAKFGKNTDFRVSITDAPGAGSYPIASFTWLLIRTDNPDAQKAKIMKDFLTWMISPEAQRMATELKYAPLPSEVVTLVRARLPELKANGKGLAQR
jgi:phosphate transport system substrate-binding protein